MAVFETLLRFVQRKTRVSPDQLRHMALSGEHKKVLAIYANNGVARSKVSDIVGYCYFQLANYEEAIPHLKKALKVSSEDYYSNLFLSLSLKNTGQTSEAIMQLMKCLKLHGHQTSMILDHLLPLVAALPDASEKIALFAQIENTTGGQRSVHIPKILFFQNRDIPKDFFRGTEFCRFYSASRLVDEGHVKYTSLGSPQKLRFVQIQGGGDLWIDSNAPYIAEVEDARILSGSSLVRVGENKIISELLTQRDFGNFVDMQYDSMVVARRRDALLVKKLEGTNEIAEGIMLCGLASGAYGHWFCEFLPKLRFFERHPRYSEIPIIIDDGMPKSHHAFLNALSKNPTYLLQKGESLRVKNLVIAPTDTFFPTELVIDHKVPPEYQPGLSPEAFSYIREGVLKHHSLSATPNSRIFLSRRNSQWRRLLEEQEIIECLKEFGFETIYIEDYSFDKQVRIFQNAEFIVGPNGSAMINSIFASPDVKMLVLGQKNVFNLGGWFGSLKELGYSPQYLAGDSVGDQRQKHLDYSIPASVVRNKIIEMLKS